MKNELMTVDRQLPADMVGLEDFVEGMEVIVEASNAIARYVRVHIDGKKEPETYVSMVSLTGKYLIRYQIHPPVDGSQPRIIMEGDRPLYEKATFGEVRLHPVPECPRGIIPPSWMPWVVMPEDVRKAQPTPIHFFPAERQQQVIPPIDPNVVFVGIPNDEGLTEMTESDSLRRLREELERARISGSPPISGLDLLSGIPDEFGVPAGMSGLQGPIGIQGPEGDPSMSQDPRPQNNLSEALDRMVDLQTEFAHARGREMLGDAAPQGSYLANTSGRSTEELSRLMMEESMIISSATIEERGGSIRVAASRARAILTGIRGFRQDSPIGVTSLHNRLIEATRSFNQATRNQPAIQFGSAEGEANRNGDSMTRDVVERMMEATIMRMTESVAATARGTSIEPNIDYHLVNRDVFNLLCPMAEYLAEWGHMPAPLTHADTVAGVLCERVRNHIRDGQTVVPMGVRPRGQWTEQAGELIRTIRGLGDYVADFACWLADCTAQGGNPVLIGSREDQALRDELLQQVHANAILRRSDDSPLAAAFNIVLQDYERRSRRSEGSSSSMSIGSTSVSESSSSS